jgi:NAD(P)-dependent dehydrogenase (short-subunit alcohol dehydrogenase family)
MTAKVVFITGGSRGIGAACAVLAAQHGYDVCINYLHNAEAAAQVVKAVEGAGQAAVALQGDIASEADIVRMFGTIDERFGRLDALVNNAGILQTQMRVEQMDAARLNTIMVTNITGTFLCSREAVLRMSTKRGGTGGAIVNVSSRAAVLGSPGEYVDYAASKAGIDALTIGLSKEVAGEGIRVNGVRPGLIHTDIHASGGEPARVARLASGVPMGRGGQPQEVAEAVVWLLTDAASFVTGSTIDVAGGR